MWSYACLTASAARCAFALILSASAVFASDLEYRVGPLDKVRVKVTEWRQSSGDIYEWVGIGGEFTVSPAGILALPIVGSLPVTDQTTTEIAAVIAERLKVTAGLVSGPTAVVEVSQYRPFYILGVVERPGEYPYRPNLSVVQAVSIAGGFYRSDPSLQRFERETIVADGEIRSNETKRLALLLRRDRLVAEQQGAPRLTFSQDIVRHHDQDLARQGMREEVSLFEARQTALQSQRDLLQKAQALLESELNTLAAKSVALEKQNQLVRKELDNINSLISRGLAVSPRQLALEQNLAQLDSQSLDIVIAQARARQDASRIEMQAAQLLNQRQMDISNDLREAQVNIRQIDDRNDALKLLILESTVTAPRLQTEHSSRMARVEFSIIRRTGGKLAEIAAGQTDPVRPGDIVKVERRSVANDRDGTAAVIPSERSSWFQRTSD